MNISLTPWREDEFPLFHDASQYTELYDNMSDDFPHTLEGCRELVSDFARHPDEKGPVRAIRVDGRVAGCIAAFFGDGMYGKSAELSYWLSKSAAGRGIMTEVVGSFTLLLFETYGIHRVFARPFAANSASRRVLEKAGFTCEGILRESVWKGGAFLDAALYARTKKQKSPAHP